VAIPSAVEELRRGGYPLMLVAEREIAYAVRDYAAAGIRAEGAAASALAAYRKLDGMDDPTVLIVTGRNIDDELHRRCVEEPDSFPD
jgi:threonine synthase